MIFHLILRAADQRAIGISQVANHVELREISTIRKDVSEDLIFSVAAGF